MTVKEVFGMADGATSLELLIPNGFLSIIDNLIRKKLRSISYEISKIRWNILFTKFMTSFYVLLSKTFW